MPKITTSKEEILMKSIPVFQENGYSGTSISLLAEACGIQKGHLYYYFKNKEEIMLAVLTHVLEKVEKELISIAWAEGKTRGERLQEFLTCFERMFYKKGEATVIVNTIITNFRDIRIFKNIATKLFDCLNEALAELYQEWYSPDYAIHKAQQALQDLQGGLIFSNIYDDPQFFKDALKRVGKKRI